MNMVIEVVHPGALTTIQDLGRPGFAHLGVPRSGAADRDSLRLANRVVGNDEGAGALETTLAGPRLRFSGPARTALAGAPVRARILGAESGREAPMETALAVRAGEVLVVGSARSGLRTYLAVSGGISAAPVLGSVATDLLTGLGPPPLRAGDRLSVGAQGVNAMQEPEPPPQPSRPADGPVEVVLGPRADWFEREAIDRLLGAEFVVTPASNRIGIRLSGPKLARARAGELPSEGVLCGAIQVPGDGQPIVLLADHPTTGGYPVIAVVVSRQRSSLGQLRPGQIVRFAAVSVS
jgi:biotin-dependent carboxylase-like uncharacterized protein